MDAFLFILIMVDITISVVMFIEIEKTLDNTFDLGREIRRMYRRRNKK